MIEDVITPAVPVAFLSVAGLAAEQQVAAADIGRFGASARLEALKQIMRSDWKKALCAWGIWMLTSLEVASCSAYVMFCTFTDNTLLLGMAALLSFTAFMHGGFRLRPYLRSPMMFLLFPDGYSRYGLLERQKPVKCFYALTTIFKFLCCFVLFYTFALVTSSDFHLSKCGRGTVDDTCEEAPPFLKASCQDKEFHGFDECMRAAPWWLANACVVSASTCPLFRSDDSLLQAASNTLGSGATVAYYTLAVIPMVAPPLSLVLWLASGHLMSCMLRWAEPECGWPELVAERTALVMQEMISGVFSPSWWALGSIYAEITLLVLDVASDINCIFMFFFVENHPAAGIIQTSILIMPILLEFIHSRSFQPLVIWRHFSKSRKLGYRTAGFIRTVQNEKGLEAPLSCGFQLAILYRNKSPKAFLSAWVSILLSGIGTAKFVYTNLHLGMIDVIQPAKDPSLDTDEVQHTGPSPTSIGVRPRDTE